MKVIDLLNKIANGEEIPQKIKWGVHEFEWFVYEYKAKDEFQEPTLLDYLSQAPSMLNDEVEIIEEPQEHKIPKKINDILRVNDLIPPVDENMYKIWEQTIKNHNKVNEIIDYLKEN